MKMKRVILTCIIVSLFIAAGLYILHLISPIDNLQDFHIDIIEKGPSYFKLKYKYNEVREGVFLLDQEPRYVLGGHLPHTFSLSLDIPENARITFGLGGKFQKQSAETASGKVMVQISVDGQERTILFRNDFTVYPDARNNRWSDVSVDLSRYGGHTADLLFISESFTQPSAKNALIGWSDIKVVPVDDIRFTKDKKPPVPRNLILVTLDDVRYNKIGFNGSTTTSTPNIDALAEESVSFNNAFSAAPWTLPSLTSLFSSLYPHEHNANMMTKLIRKKIPMLAEIMRDNGYRTVGFTGKKTYADIKFGFFSGFENLSENSDEQNLVDTLRWVDMNGDSPFFLWVHFDGAHKPFSAPEPFLRKNKDYDGIVDEHSADKLYPDYLAGKVRFGSKDIERIRELYDSMIDYTDYKIGKLVEGLRRKNILDKTMLIITSDHGEQILGKYDHGFLDHGVSVYDELLHVPLIIRFPDRTVRPGKISELVSLVDILPTVLAYFSIPAEDVQLSGINLIPLIKSPDYKLRREFIVAEEANRFYLTLRSKKWKYIYLDLNLMNRFKLYPESFTSYQSEMLFMLGMDPYEQLNVAKRYPKVVQAMRERVSKIIEKSKSSNKQGTIEIDEQTKEKLKTLGYL